MSILNRLLFGVERGAPSHGDAMVTVANEGGNGALKAMGDAIERNHEETIRLLQQELDAERSTVRGLQGDLAHYKRIDDTVRRRVRWLLGEDDLDIELDLDQNEIAHIVRDEIQGCFQ